MNKRITRIMITYLLGVIFGLSPSFADDIEIYTNPGSNSGTEPLVMFSVDYRPNLGSTVCQGTDGNGVNECQTLYTDGHLTADPSTETISFFMLLRAVLKKVLGEVSGVKVGLMLNHQHEQNCVGPNASECSNGGFIASGFPDSNMTEVQNKANFIAALDALPPTGGNVSHSYQGKELFFEFFRYLTGQGVYNGHLGFSDFTGDLYPCVGHGKGKCTLPDPPHSTYDQSIINGSNNYLSPIQDLGLNCGKIFTVNFMFQVSNQESDSDDAIEETKANGGMENVQREGNKPSFDTVLDWLHRTDLADGSFGTAGNMHGTQNVKSYFVVDPKHINNTTRGYAQNGGTIAPYELSDDPDELVSTLKSIMSQILSVSTTFTAASIPVSVLNRAQVVDNVYLALFEADPDGRPMWPGNLKKLKIDIDNGLLLDATNNNAVASDGRVRHDALTYWTVPGDLDDTDLSDDEVAGKDGRSVKRGGAGQRIPGYLSSDPGDANADGIRTVYYEPSTITSGAAPPAMDVSDAVKSDLQTEFGAADLDEAERLIRFARGEGRSWWLGDPLHSRPLPINYGARSGYSDTNPDIRILMGTNHGFMHMFKNTNSSGGELGQEAWAFMPRAVMPVVKKHYENPSESPSHADYGVDGAPAVYVDDVNDDGVISGSDKVWLYFGLRRGGRYYYAMDISDPDAPKLMWSVGPNSSGFGEMGYTFSNPRVGMLDWGSGEKPVVMFAAGYDKDTKDTGGYDDTNGDDMGNAIYVVDAQTGALVWKATGDSGASSGFIHASMKDSIPSDLTVLDTDGDNLIDRMYVGDTGGVVWRVDVNGTNTAAWKATRLANLGRRWASSNKDTHDRRFFHRPDFVQHKDENGAYDAVILGSGDRANPLDLSVNDFFYMIKDRNIGAGGGDEADMVVHDAVSGRGLGDITDNCLQTSSCGGSAPDLTYGWRLQLEESGEKGLATATTVLSAIYFTSYIPADGSDPTTCEPNEGSGRLYVVDLEDGRAVRDYDLGNNGGSDVDSDNLGKDDRYQTLESGGIPSEVVFVPKNRILKPDLTLEELPVKGRWKTFWYPVEN